MHDITPVMPLALALFAGSLSQGVKPSLSQQSSGTSLIAITKQIQIAMPTDSCARIFEVRARLENMWMKTLDQKQRKSWRGRGTSGVDANAEDVLQYLQEFLSAAASCTDFMDP